MPLSITKVTGLLGSGEGVTTIIDNVPRGTSPCVDNNAIDINNTAQACWQLGNFTLQGQALDTVTVSTTWVPCPAARFGSRRSSLEMVHWTISFASQTAPYPFARVSTPKGGEAAQRGARQRSEPREPGWPRRAQP